jgi:hypothetical protein
MAMAYKHYLPYSPDCHVKCLVSVVKVLTVVVVVAALVVGVGGLAYVIVEFGGSGSGAPTTPITCTGTAKTQFKNMPELTHTCQVTRT